jgi:ribonuclease BN (tRNA processing enzyme)
MFIKFYGTRGSIPTPLKTEEYLAKLREILSLANANDIQSPQSIDDFISALPFYLKATYGGNTSCVYVNIDGTHIAFDMGSGFRELGLDLLTKDFGRESDEIFTFISHTHWDHIQGLPFFIPAFLEGNTMHMHSPTDMLKQKLEMQQYAQFFPVELSEMGADIKYYQLECGREYKIKNFTVSTIRLNHPNTSYGYKIKEKGKIFVYATDTEFNEQSLDFFKECIEFFRDADLLVFDSQYTYRESFEKIHYGHSSANTGIDIAIKSGVKRLAFFHHEPAYSDKKMYEFYKEVIQYRNAIASKLDLDLIPAYDGLEIKL